MSQGSSDTWWGSPTSTPTRQLTRDALLVFFIALFVRIIALFFFAEQNPFFATTLEGFDQHTYQTRAHEILQGNWRLDGHSNYFSMLMPYYVAGIYFLFGPDNFWMLHFSISLIGSVGIGFLFVLARTWLSRGAAWCAVIMATLYAPWLFYESSLLQEGLVVTFYIVALWGLRTAQLEWRGTGRRLIIAGIALGLAYIGRGNAILVALILAAWLLVAGGRISGSSLADIRAWGWTRTSVFLLGFLSILLVAAWRNYAAVDDFTIGGENGIKLFYIGNGIEADGTYGYGDRFLKANAIARETGDSSVFMDFFWEDLAANPGAIAWNLVRKTYQFFAVRDLPDNLNYQLSRQFITPLWVTPVQPHWFVPLGLAGLLLSFGVWRSERLSKSADWSLLWFFLASFAASIVLILATGRYRVPAAVPLAILAGYCLQGLVHSIKQNRWKNCLGTLSIAVLFAVLLWPWGKATPQMLFDQNDPFIRINDYTNLVAAAIKAENHTAAARALDLAWHRYADEKNAYPMLLHSEIRFAESAGDAARLIRAANQVHARGERHELTTQLMLAQIDVWLGNVPRARAMVDQILAENPGNEGAEQLVRDLERLSE